MNKNVLTAVWVVILVVVSAGICQADTVVTTDGRILQGSIESQEPDGTVYMKLKYGSVVVPRARIASMKRGQTLAPVTRQRQTTASADAKAKSEAAGPAYYMLPIVGEIGVEVKAEYLEKAMALARSRSHILVLYIDSPGGSVAETEKIVSVLSRAKGIRTMAYVRRAMSAAAVIAMACQDICMDPEATIGGAVPYTVGPAGTPKAVSEKFKSAMRAQCRIAAELGGHSPLIMEGMIDPAIALVVKTVNGTPQVAVGSGGKVLKASGKILTLTAKEAVECGLAKGIVENPDDACRMLGLQTWRQAKWGGWLQMTIAAKTTRSRLTVKTRRDEFQKKVGPQLEKIEDAMVKIRSDIKVTMATKAMIDRNYDMQVAMVNARYKEAMKRAHRKSAYSAYESAELRDGAISARTSGLHSRLSSHQSQMMSLKTKVNTLKAQYGLLLRQKRKLMADAPV